MADRESTGRNRTAEAGTKRMPPWLRRVGVVVIFLLAGAIINVLVAWGFLLHSNKDTASWSNRGRIFPDYGQYVRSPKERESRTTVEYFRGELWISQWVRPSREDGTPTIDEAVFHAMIPRWSEFRVHEPGKARAVQSGENRATFYYSEHAAGWPLRSVRGRRIFDMSGEEYEMEFPGVIQTPKWVGVDHVWGQYLPYIPIMPEFLANSLLYGSALFIVIRLLGFPVRRFGRRRRRLKQGLCPSCGYDLRGADHGKCPECGEAVARKRRQPNSRTAKQVEN